MNMWMCLLALYIYDIYKTWTHPISSLFAQFTYIKIVDFFSVPTKYQAIHGTNNKKKGWKREKRGNCMNIWRHSTSTLWIAYAHTIVPKVSRQQIFFLGYPIGKFSIQIHPEITFFSTALTFSLFLYGRSKVFGRC